MDSKLNGEVKENKIQEEINKDKKYKPSNFFLDMVKTGKLYMKSRKEVIKIEASIVLNKDEKIKLKEIHKLFENKKIDLLEIDVFKYKGKIDTFNMVNDDNDDKIDLFKYSTNVYDGKIDLDKLTNRMNGRIDLLLLNGITDDAGQLNFTKVCIGTNPLTINNNIIDLDKYFYNGKLILSKIKILNANSNIDIFDFAQCISDGKIDQSKLCNSESDASIDIFEYTTNHSGGKLDISMFTDSENQKKIDLLKFNGIINSDGSIIFSMIFDSCNPGKLDYNILNLNKFFHLGKLNLSKMKIFNANENIDLFDFKLLISSQKKIDQAKLCNSDTDDSIDIFKYTVNHLNNKIEIMDFINSSYRKVDLFMFNGITDNEGRVDFTRINYNKHTKKEIYSHINSNKFFDGGKLILSKINISSEEGKIDLFNFLDYAPYIVNGQIDQTKICNSVSNNSIDIFKYTTNFSNNKIELANFTNSIDGKLDLFKFNGVTDAIGRVDFTRISYSRNPKNIIYSYINIDKFFHNGKLMLSKIKISSDRGLINLFDFTPCLSNGRIDQSKICNSESDDSINIFMYTVNHLNGKIDISKFTNSKSGKLDLLKFTGIKGVKGQVDYTKIYDSSNANTKS